MTSILIKGVNALIANNKRTIRDLQNRKTLNLASVIEVEKWVKRNFQKEGTLHDSPSLHWKPLSKRTLAERRKGKGKGRPKILDDTGRLKSNWKRSASDRFGVLESMLEYSSTHEFGEGKVPKRKIFPTQKQTDKILDPVFDKFKKKIEERYK